MSFTIEPMINAGKRHIKILPDQWTAVTKDHKLSAQWEHTLMVTADGFEIFTLRAEENYGNRRSCLLQRSTQLYPRRKKACVLSLGVSTLARRETLARATSALAERYWNNEPIEDLVDGLTATFDRLIIDLWQQHFGNTRGCALFAGGYGRAELHPQSDIDILVLAEHPQQHRETIEAFLRDVFDLNVEVGHSVRDVKTCVKECQGDITVATALFERRFLTGDSRLVAALDKALQHRKIWPVEAFFIAKRDEQTPAIATTTMSITT